MAGFSPEVLDLLRKLGGGVEGGLGYTIPYHVSKDGLNTNDGLSWEKAFLDIQAGLDAVGALAERGRGVVLVGPGAYTETLTTPLNTDAPFGALLGVNPVGGLSAGGVYLASPVVGTALLTVRARGWRIAGFELACPTGEAGIKLDQLTPGCMAAYTQIDHCRFTTGLYGIVGYGAPPEIHILDNLFSLLLEAGSIAITSSNITWSNPNLWTVLRNIFIANTNHIDFRPNRGPFNATILDNVLHKTYVPGGTVGQMINLSGGGSNIISKNVLGGAYTNAGGYRQGDANDDWFGNFADIAGGVTQANPA